MPNSISKRRLKPKRTSVASASTTAPTTTSASRAVIWIDGTPLLRAEQEKLRSKKKKLLIAEERVKLHKLSDSPLYQTWFNATFADRLAEIRALYEKLADLDAIVWKVEREILATGCSAADAYQTVLMAIEDEARQSVNGAEGRRPRDDSNGDSQDGAEPHRSQEDEPSNHGSFGSDDDTSTSFGEGLGRHGSSSASDKATDDAVKQVYRALVRLLHPDLNPDLSPELTERWYEVQQAYHERDLARLEMLLAACEGGAAGGDESFIDKIQSLSRLRLLLQTVSRKLKSSQRLLSQLKQEPAWEFHKVRQDSRRLAWLERDVKFELRGAEESLTSDIRLLEMQIARWAQPATTRREHAERSHRRGRGRSRQRSEWDLDFGE